MTRLRQVWWVRFPHSPAILLAAVVATVLPPSSAGGQQTDTIPRPSATGPIVDTLPGPLIVIPPRPPISPRRAFVRSLFLPGWGQVGLERNMAAGVYAATEVLAVGMLRKSALDLREARRAPVDSTVATWQTDPNTGQPILDPQTGQPIPATWVMSDIGGRVRARKTHMEDWIAILLFNHLFAAADAYVAAHLWDFPARVGASVTPQRETRISASIAF